MTASQDFAARLPALGQLAQWVEQAWDIGQIDQIALVNLSENAMYRVDSTDGQAYALRLSQPGYQSDSAIDSELWVIRALADLAASELPALSGMCFARPIGGMQVLGKGWRCALFSWLGGAKIDRCGLANGDFAPLHRLETVIAGLETPPGFERPVWRPSTFLAPHYAWGDWRAHHGVRDSVRRDLEAQERQVLAVIGDVPCRRLCHGDLRAANLLRMPDGRLGILDFDDSGYAWPGFGLAAALSFDEALDTVPGRVKAWFGDSDDHRAGLPESLVLRRLSLIGWMTTHPQAPEAKELGADYVDQTVGLLDRLRRALG